MRKALPRRRLSRRPTAASTAITAVKSGALGLDIHPLRDHAESLFVLAEWLYREWYEPIGDSREDALQTLIERMNRFALPMALVAVEDGEPVGMASLIWNKCPAGLEIPCLAGLYVVPERRGQGIGTLLCRGAMQRAAEIGFPSLALFTPDRADFYRRIGWAQEGSKAFRGRPVRCAYMRTQILPINASTSSSAA